MAQDPKKKSRPLRIIGGNTSSSRRTIEKKLKKKGMTDAQIKKALAKKPERKKLYKQRVIKKTTPRKIKATYDLIYPSKTKRKLAPRAVDKGGRLSARGSEGFKPTNTRVGPNMSKVNKKGAKGGGGADRPRKKGPSGPTMTSMGRPSTGPKPRNKDPKVNLKKRGPSRPSMTGFNRGGSIDGCAKRGLTRAKRSR